MPPKLRPSAPADRHLANVLGAVTLDIETRIGLAIESAVELSMVQATALSALANYADGGSTDLLRRAVGLSHSATVRLIDRLQQVGYVTRGGDGGDRRVTAIHLTPRGRELVTEIRTARNSVLREWVRRLSGEQRSALAGVLDDVAAYDVAPAPEGIDTSQYVCRLCDARACGHPTQCPVTEAVRDTTD